MHAERTPFVGIVLALVFVAVETVGLLAYASAPEPVGLTHSGDTGGLQHFKRVKVRCHR